MASHSSNFEKYNRPVKFWVFFAGVKVIGIRPMAPVLNKVHLKVSEHEMLSFSVRKEIIKKDNSLVVILLSKVVENEFLHIV